MATPGGSTQLLCSSGSLKIVILLCSLMGYVEQYQMELWYQRQRIQMNLQNSSNVHSMFIKRPLILKRCIQKLVSVKIKRTDIHCTSITKLWVLPKHVWIKSQRGCCLHDHVKKLQLQVSYVGQVNYIEVCVFLPLVFRSYCSHLSWHQQV